MELHPVGRTVPQADAHDLAVILGGGRHEHVGGTSAWLDHQGMVSDGGKALRQSREETVPVMQDAGGLAVPHGRSPDHAGPRRQAQALVPQADAQQRDMR